MSGLFTEQAHQWYSQLKDASQDARYEVGRISDLDFQDLRQNNFEPFKSFVRSKLRP